MRVLAVILAISALALDLGLTSVALAAPHLPMNRRGFMQRRDLEERATAKTKNNNNNKNDPQTSLSEFLIFRALKGASAHIFKALDPSQIQKALTQDGNEDPAAGQVASLTSSNNLCVPKSPPSQFNHGVYYLHISINFCLTQKGVPLTNGTQVKTGSCNPTPVRA